MYIDKKYPLKIEIKINASKEKVWDAITDFKNYPKWNSVLEIKNNDSLLLGNKFQVTINQPNGKQSKFKAEDEQRKITIIFSNSKNS